MGENMEEGFFLVFEILMVILAASFFYIAIVMRSIRKNNEKPPSRLEIEQIVRRKRKMF
jgi:hypothetical protein